MEVMTQRADQMVDEVKARGGPWAEVTVRDEGVDDDEFDCELAAIVSEP